MLIFHEGLPRSGKSYEAMVRHIIPSLKAGRKVYAFLDGPEPSDPNCKFTARIAEAAELPVERVRELYSAIKRDDVLGVHAVVEDNAFVVLDEAQNFWPSGREKLPPAMMQFVTEHGHRGLDILLMGQDIRDVHAIWRRRVSQKVCFHKLDAVGQEHRYNATVFKATSPEKFEKVTAALGVYDPKYFGTYASHVSESTNTANYVDARASIRNTAFVKWGLPAMGVALVYGVITVWRFFHGGAVTAPPPQAAASAPAPALPAPREAAAPTREAKVRKEFIEDLNERYRPRLAFVYERGGAYVGAVEWWDGDELREKLTFVQIAVLGGTVDVRGSVVKVSGAWATPWPMKERRQATPSSELVPTGRMLTGAVGS